MEQEKERRKERKNEQKKERKKERRKKKEIIKYNKVFFFFFFLETTGIYSLIKLESLRHDFIQGYSRESQFSPKPVNVAESYAGHSIC